MPFKSINQNSSINLTDHVGTIWFHGMMQISWKVFNKDLLCKKIADLINLISMKQRCNNVNMKSADKKKKIRECSIIWG